MYYTKINRFWQFFVCDIIFYMEKIDIFGVKLDNISFEDAIKIVKNSFFSKKQIKIFTPNPEILLKAKKDKNFKEILNNADLLIPDGSGLVFFSKIKKNIPGIDFMLAICKLAEKENKKVFLLGGKNGVAQKTKDALKNMFFNINICEVSEDLSSCYNLIKNSNPDIIFVALGAPKQEIWISENLNKFPTIKVAMGVGGAFDILSGKIKRAPLFLRKIHLEWLWRFLKEPKKRFKRIINAVFVFPVSLFFYKIKK